MEFAEQVPKRVCIVLKWCRFISLYLRLMVVKLFYAMPSNKSVLFAHNDGMECSFSAMGLSFTKSIKLYFSYYYTNLHIRP